MTTQILQVNRPSAGPAIGLAESGLVPDSLIRAGIRRLCRRRLREIGADDCARVAGDKHEFVHRMRGAVIAPLPELANEQHYEVPAQFFTTVLGRHRKYSCCQWDPGVSSLDQAEAAALAMTCERAGIEAGHEVLDLGCGWGSLTLWMAQNYPGIRVTAVSNARPQREYIQEEARKRGLDNVRVITCDMNHFDIRQHFDRVVSVEMFEHMRNYPLLFARIGRWLKPDGRFFMHIFCHRSAPYEFEDKGPGDWMSRHFFSGGIMPSADLPLWFQDHLALRQQWIWDGTHYQKTANAWLGRLDENRQGVKRIFEEVYGTDVAGQWMMRWRIFFMACAELFGMRNGQEWFVSHYLFAPRNESAGG